MWTATLVCLSFDMCRAQGLTGASNLRSEVEHLETEFTALSGSFQRHEQLLAEVREISQELPHQKRSVETLKLQSTSRQLLVEELKCWATASLVLGNQRTPNAAALKETLSGYQVIAVANHPFQQYAIAAAIQGGVPCRADAGCATVLEELLGDLYQGKTLPMVTSGDLNTRISQLISLSPVKESGLQFMVFHDPISGDQKVAVVQSSPEGKSVRTVDKAIDKLAESAFTGGSVWVGNQDEIEPHIEIGDPFVDYCTLGIIHSLGREEFLRKNVSLSIKVKLDSSLINTTPKTPSVRTSIYLGDKPITEGILALGRHLQDEFYERLTRRGMPVVEREYETDIKEEVLRPSLGELAPHITKATHAVILEVDKSADGADRVSVRLVDVTSSHSIWAANDSRSLIPNKNWRSYILHTGVPSIAEFRSEATRDRILKHFSIEGIVTARPPRKLILINEGSDGQTFRVRSLYGIQTIEVPKDEVILTAIVSAAGERVQADYENTTGKQILHYAAWRLSRHLAPPAVRMSAPLDSAHQRSWVLPLGSANGIVPNSRFRLLFPTQQSQTLSLFPSVACVAEVLDSKTSRMVAPGNPAMQIPELRNAIAVCDSWEHCKVAVMPPVVPIKMKIPPKKFFELKSRGYEFGQQFRTAFMESLASRVDCLPGVWEVNPRSNAFWDEGIDRRKTMADLRKRGVTHVMCGVVETISNSNRTELHYGLQRISAGENGEVVEGPVIDSIRVLLSQGDL